MVKSDKLDKRQKRKQRIRKKVSGTSGMPRVSVFRSGKHIYASVIDDNQNSVLFGVSSLTADLRETSASLKKKERAKKVGELLARKCLEKGIEKVVFDRNGFDYKGRIAFLADGAREAGLKF